MRTAFTREEAEDMAEAHAEGWHTPPDGLPREGCPECERRDLSSYPREKDIKREPPPGVFDLRKQLGRAPTAEEYRQSRGRDK